MFWPIRVSPTPSRPITRIMPNTVAVSKFCDATMINCPSPVALRKNSAAMTPTRARPFARAERARNFDELWLDAARAFDGVVENREHGKKKNNKHLWDEAETHQREDEGDQRHHGSGIEDHDVWLDPDPNCADPREQKAGRHADDKREREAGEKQNRGVEKLRPCTPVGQENGESSHGLREGHQERRARAAPGNFPDGKTGEQARQRNGRARQLVRSHAAPVPGLPASHRRYLPAPLTMASASRKTVLSVRRS